MVPDVFDICLYICEWKWYDQFAFFLLGTHEEKLKKVCRNQQKTTHTLLRIYYFFSFWFLNSFSLPLPYGGNLWYRMLGIFIILHKSFFCLSTAAAAAVLLWLLAKNQSIFIFICMCVCLCVFFWKRAKHFPFGLGIAEKTQTKIFNFFLSWRTICPLIYLDWKS